MFISNKSTENSASNAKQHSPPPHLVALTHCLSTAGASASDGSPGLGFGSPVEVAVVSCTPGSFSTLSELLRSPLSTPDSTSGWAAVRSPVEVATGTQPLDSCHHLAPAGPGLDTPAFHAEVMSLGAMSPLLVAIPSPTGKKVSTPSDSSMADVGQAC